mmetsp:Transcript_15480/g.33682  ORF Transcript_15480/g.33682 Transcript_15480/m.33682 type:complete len:231 (+) Transcript_15480:144-836(+)|eukprot:CAMPEP_0178505496 /NCGR_PEP_ID=MMETSP0696-20121128/19162_1 /TAXON_ID=265572 /ORGANISM="Extubocellulus spinifer, Strain CCMP396" /LENGTH=230 /DNA_ID=CAMNT_0020134811 /DNA_START=115 /DNA_END=807 /DNA_ORIENTATION=-
MVGITTLGSKHREDVPVLFGRAFRRIMGSPGVKLMLMVSSAVTVAMHLLASHKLDPSFTAATTKADPEQARSAHVKELLTHVEEEYKHICEGMLNGEPMSFAQGWQDWMIYHNYFRDRLWGDGFYLDIGTNDATFISNTLFFDKCLGWRGICAEPQARYHEKIVEKRGCTLLPNCVLGKDKTVKQGKSGVDAVFHEIENPDPNAKDSQKCYGIQSLVEQFDFETTRCTGR